MYSEDTLNNLKKQVLAPKPERNKKIYQLRKQGWTYPDIGAVYGITPQRAQFICKKEAEKNRFRKGGEAI